MQGSQKKKTFKIVKEKTNWISEVVLKRLDCFIWKEKRENHSPNEL